MQGRHRCKPCGEIFGTDALDPCDAHRPDFPVTVTHVLLRLGRQQIDAVLVDERTQRRRDQVAQGTEAHHQRNADHEARIVRVPRGRKSAKGNDEHQYEAELIPAHLVGNGGMERGADPGEGIDDATQMLVERHELRVVQGRVYQRYPHFEIEVQIRDRDHQREQDHVVGEVGEDDPARAFALVEHDENALGDQIGPHRQGEEQADIEAQYDADLCAGNDGRYADLQGERQDHERQRRHDRPDQLDVPGLGAIPREDREIDRVEVTGPP